MAFTQVSSWDQKGFDPALVAETHKNTAYLLEMIKHVAPVHSPGLRLWPKLDQAPNSELPQATEQTFWTATQSQVRSFAF